MRRLLLLTALLCAALSSCAPPPTVAVDPTEPADTAGPASLAVAVSRGQVARVSARGGVIEALAVPGLEPGHGVYDPVGERLLLLSEDDSLWVIETSEALSARRVGALEVSREERACLGVSGEEFLSHALQNHDDLSLSSATDEVCVVLQDRNDNMADVQVLVAVSLSTGSARSAVLMDATGSCAETEMSCGASPRPSRPATTRRWRQETSCVLTAEGRRVDLRPLLGLPADASDEACDADGVSLDGESPSGRFVTVYHDLEEGDYMHFDVAVLDLGDSPDDIPRNLTALTLDAVGESRVVWSRRADALVLEDDLVLLGDEPRVVTLGCGGALVE